MLKLSRNTCIILSLLIVIALACAWHWLHLPNNFPVKKVKFYGNYQYITPIQLRNLVEPYADNNFFDLNMGAIKRTLAQQAVIEKFEIKRIWPSILYIKIIEQHPVAIWGNSQLLSKTGVIFKANLTQAWQKLPTFIGNKKNIKAMLKNYAKMSTQLDTINLHISNYSLTFGDDTTLQLSPGDFTLYLGNKDINSRLQKFIIAYPILMQKNLNKELSYIDMVYPEAMAVRWKASWHN